MWLLASLTVFSILSSFFDIFFPIFSIFFIIFLLTRDLKTYYIPFLGILGILIEGANEEKIWILPIILPVIFIGFTYLKKNFNLYNPFIRAIFTSLIFGILFCVKKYNGIFFLIGLICTIILSLKYRYE